MPVRPVETFPRDPRRPLVEEDLEYRRTNLFRVHPVVPLAQPPCSLLNPRVVAARSASAPARASPRPPATQRVSWCIRPKCIFVEGVLLLDHLPDSLRPVPAGPCAEQRIRVVIRSRPVIRACRPALFRVHKSRHVFGGNQPVPLVLGVPAGSETELLHLAHRNPADGLVPEVAVHVGGHHAKGGHSPGADRFPEFFYRIGAIQSQQRSQPTAIRGAKPLQRHGPRTCRLQRAAVRRQSGRCGRNGPSFRRCFPPRT